MSLEKQIKYKLLAFKRKFLWDLPIITWVVNYVIKYLTKKQKKIKQELLEEYATEKDLTAPYLFFFGKLDFFSYLLLLFFFSIFVHFFPFFISDMLWDLASFLWWNPLLALIALPLVFCFILFFIPSSRIDLINQWVLGLYLVLYAYSVFLLGRFDFSSDEFQFQYGLGFVEDQYFLFNFVVGVDGLSVLLVVLTSFLFLLVVFFNQFSIKILVKESALAYSLLYVFTIFSFISLDLFFFYFFFEAILIPLFIIIGIWGARDRKIYAAYKLFFYTLCSSLVTLVGFVALYFASGTSDVLFLSSSSFSPFWQKLLWVLFFLSFAVKLPMIPIHLWLPEAHVEAPTGCSVILAGILLKLGGYGFFRFLMPLFPGALEYFSPLLLLLSLLAILYASLIALRQNDIKKLIAYSSVSHMGFVTLASSNFSDFSIFGGIFIMLSHGLIASALFFSIGFLYERYKTRSIVYYSSLASTMPIFSSCFFLLILANIAFPSTTGFIGEFFVLVGLVPFNLLSIVFATAGVIFSAAYSLWLFNRLCFGPLSTKYITLYQDLDIYETFILISFIILIFLFGLFPSFIFSYLDYFTYGLTFVSLFK